MRQDPKPLPGQAVDLLGAESVADRLQASGVRAPQDTVVERLEANTLDGKLPLGILMSIDAELPIIGKVGAEFQKEGPKITINTVKVVLIDKTRRAYNPGVRPSSLRVPTLLRAEDRHLLLSLADEQDSLLTRKAGSVLCGHIIFPLSLLEEYDRDLVLLGKVFDGAKEGLADGVHQG